MAAVPDLIITHEKIIDKSSIVYGESGTGKSWIIVDMLHALRPYIDQIIVFAPTDRQNHTYDKGIVPLPCIHYTITPKLLTDIWSRQEALVAVYTQSNNLTTLKSLYGKIMSARRSATDSVIAEVNVKFKTFERELAEKGLDDDAYKNKLGEMREDCDKLLLEIYKTSISKETQNLSRLNLTDREQYTLKYHGLNPRLVIVFDDCTDLIKKYKSHDVMQKIFYQGRHSKITAILAVHTDKALDSELKKNAAISIFTALPCASAYITRPSTSMDKESQLRALSACKIAFGDPTRPHQKLAFVRHEKKFYKFTAQKRENFSFCSAIVKSFCKIIAVENGKVSADNQFIAEFN
jgi:hypothetical protein